MPPNSPNMVAMTIWSSNKLLESYHIILHAQKIAMRKIQSRHAKALFKYVKF